MIFKGAQLCAINIKNMSPKGESNMEILSPMPGVFYRKPSPESANYVEVGQEVQQGDVLGLIEVMKQYSELTAEKRGVIESILIDDGDAIEAGQAVVVIR